MEIYLSGQFIPTDEAQVRLDDSGFQHAVGLFETMAAFHGRVFRLSAHLERLARSAKELGLVPSIDTQPLIEAVRETLARNGLQEARLRLTLTPGSMSLLRPQGAGGSVSPPTPTLAIVPSAPTKYDRAYFSQGITVLVAPPLANPFDPMQGHKTLNYWGRLRTLRQAASVGAGEAIWLSVTNHLASGAISNIFLVRGGELLTPIARGEEASGAIGAPVLPGITRAAVIELAEARRIPVHRKMLTIDDLLGADEVFLTNSSWQVLPVTRVEKQPVADGLVGPMTRTLRESLLATIERETREPDGDLA